MLLRQSTQKEVKKINKMGESCCVEFNKEYTLETVYTTISSENKKDGH
jgi:hypothetical protein